jgi:hypothetical protein
MRGSTGDYPVDNSCISAIGVQAVRCTRIAQRERCSVTCQTQVSLIDRSIFFSRMWAHAIDAARENGRRENDHMELSFETRNSWPKLGKERKQDLLSPGCILYGSYTDKPICRYSERPTSGP